MRCTQVVWGMVVGIMLTGAASSTAWAQKVSEGFRAELIYKTPDIEHPSVVTCDDEGNLFVGEDPMDMRGPTTKEFDRVLMIRWGADGQPARKTVFCENLGAVFGLVWHEQTLYVMHAPHYSMFKDTDGDGVADVRKDLAEGFGPSAGVYGFNDHIVTGTRLGLDGLIYVSVGDKGIPKATGADGSTITLEGGGVVRMRPDGTQLEIYSSGTRNHLDVAMDSLDNVFTYDNTDDGLGWWTRFTHHIPTGYYGYPYDYHPHPERHLPRISEHGGGSPVGAACYREAAWPEKYRESPFFCEWGKGKIQRFALKKQGASFTSEIEDFMVKDGAEEFRPLDLCFSPDGKFMYVADWNYGGWTKALAAGRLYRVSYTGTDVAPEPPRVPVDAPHEALIKALGHPAHSQRFQAQWALAARGATVAPALAAALKGTASRWAKIHAIWTENAIADRSADYHPEAEWIAALKDDEPDVRAQAARALGLKKAKLAAPALQKALLDKEPTVRLQVAVALGRIGDAAAAKSLFAALGDDDVYVRFALIQAVRALNRWDDVPAALQASPTSRQAVLVALSTSYDDGAVAALAEAVRQAPTDGDRAHAISALAELYRKADPYTSGWWGTRPAASKPSRPKQHDWSGSSAVAKAIRNALAPGQPAAVRVAAASSARDVDNLSIREALRSIAAADAELSVRREAMSTLADLKDADALPVFVKAAGDARTDEAVREAAVRGIAEIGSADAVRQLVQILNDKNSAPRLVELALDALSRTKSKDALPAVQQQIFSTSALVRARAADALATLAGAAAVKDLRPLLTDPGPEVRQAAVVALGRLKARDAVPDLIQAAHDPAVRFEAEVALAAIPDARALACYLDGLASPNADLRKATQQALVQIRDQIEKPLIELHQRNELPAAARAGLQTVFSTPVPILNWKMIGPFPKPDRPAFDPTQAPDFSARMLAGDEPVSWKDVKSDDPAGRVSLNKVYERNNSMWALAYIKLPADVSGPQQFIVGSDDQLVVWVNGKQVYEFMNNRGWSPEQGRFSADFRPGDNLIWILSGNDGGPWDFSMQVAQKNPKAAFLFADVPAALDPSAYTQFALKNKGDAPRGQKIFFDAKGVGCVKCHAVGGEGGKIGPDLAGIGSRYAREELIRSVLEPSNRIASGYEVTIVETQNGRIVTGLAKSESPEAIELMNVDGQVIRIATSDIEEKQRSTLSLMPNGLKDGMSLENFADVIAFLAEQKQTPAPGAAVAPAKP